jgi:IclR family transcriptional regulator, pca regulon regulatory protein
MSRIAIHATNAKYRVESVGRALDLLAFLARADRPLPLRDIVAGLGWNKATVYRLLRTLADHSAVRELRGKGYVLGPLMVTIGQAALEVIELAEVARPHLERFHDELQETVNLAMLDGDEVVYLSRYEGPQILGVRLRVGSRLPAYCTSLGQVLLAGLSDQEVRRRLKGTAFARRGPNTLASRQQLLERLNVVRAQGYALNDEELAIGHRAASAPIRDHAQAVVAAINVSVSAARISRHVLVSRLAPRLVEAADAISADLGAATPPPIAASVGGRR